MTDTLQSDGEIKQGLDRFRQISEISKLINEGIDLNDLLTRLTEAVCRHSDWSISSVLVMDEARQMSVSAARYDPLLTFKREGAGFEWDLMGSPILEIVSKGRPMIMQDASEQEKYPAFQRDAQLRGYRTVVLVPLRFPDEQGRPIVFCVLADEVVDVSETELSFLQCLADLADIAVRRMQILRQETAEAERLREITVNLTSALTTTLDPDHASDLYGGLSRLFTTGWFAIDLTTGQMLFDRAGASPLLQKMCDRLPESVVRTAMKADAARGDQTVRLLVEDETLSALMRPLVIDGTRVGALFLLNVETLAASEQVAADAGRLALSSLILRNYMAFKTREHASRRLIGQLCQGDLRDLGELREEARLLGFDLDRPMYLIGLRSLGEDPLEEDSHSFVQRSAQTLFGQVLSYKDGHEVYLLVLDDDTIRDGKLRDRFLQRIRPIMPETVAVMSDRIDRLQEVAPAREACRWNLQVAEAMGARDWVNRRTVGSFPSLMASVSHRVADQFLSDTIARVAENGSGKGDTVLETLEAYLATGRRPQETADLLGIHVSTLRYRLGRIAEKSGIDLNDPDECFELELALRIHKFRISYQK